MIFKNQKVSWITKFENNAKLYNPYHLKLLSIIFKRRQQQQQKKSKEVTHAACLYGRHLKKYFTCFSLESSCVCSSGTGVPWGDWKEVWSGSNLTTIIKHQTARLFTLGGEQLVYELQRKWRGRWEGVVSREGAKTHALTSLQNPLPQFCFQDVCQCMGGGGASPTRSHRQRMCSWNTIQIVCEHCGTWWNARQNPASGLLVFSVQIMYF